MAKEKLFLIDGHALCYRSFYAIRSLTTSKGRPTNAIFGFVRVLRSLIKEHKPDYLAVCFDSKEKTKRQEKFAEYKIQRPSMPEDLRSQIPVIKEIIGAFNIPIFEKGGYEADDIIATISKKSASKDLDVVIVSDDKDLYQIAAKNIKYYNSKSGSILGTQELKEKLGFDPVHITDFIGLAGDSSDNIPGVTGIGAVSARNLIKEHGTLEKILKHFTNVKELKGKEKILLDHQKEAEFSKELAILDADVPVKCSLKELKISDPDRKKLFSFFQELEFRKLAEEFSDQKPGKAIQSTSASSEKDFKPFVSEAEKKGRFSFIFDAEEDENGDVQGTIFLMAGTKTYESSFKNCLKLKQIFENKKIAKDTYDFKKALRIVSTLGITIEGDTFDIMLAGYLLGSTQASFELSSLSWTYLKRSLSEENVTADYVKTVNDLKPVLAKEMKGKSLTDLFNDIELPLARVLFEMEACGVNLDVALLKRLSKDCAGKIDALKKKLFKIAGEEFNINSPKQLSKILFDKLGLPVIKKTKTGFSTNESVLNILAQQHEFPSLILDYRQLTKLKSTYIDALPNMVNPKTGRIHAQFNQAGTETGRLSSSNPNLQNIPVRTELGKQIRKAIIPSKKELIMVSSDYSQIELRILAHLSKDEGLIKAFTSGQDIHNYTASLIFDVKEEDVTPDMRNAAKRVNFGIIYGISAFGLANDLKVTQPEAQEFIDKYFLRYPSVKKFMAGEIKNCEKKGYVLTILNRRRYIPEIKSKQGPVRQFAQRQAMNTPIQGSAADVLKLAMINIHNEIKKKKMKSRMVSTVHDELVFETPKSEKKALIDMVRDKMEHAVKLSVPVKVSVKAGRNWLEMEEV